MLFPRGFCLTWLSFPLNLSGIGRPANALLPHSFTRPLGLFRCSSYHAPLMRSRLIECIDSQYLFPGTPFCPSLTTEVPLVLLSWVRWAGPLPGLPRGAEACGAAAGGKQP